VLTIGQFARMTRLSAKQLRTYDAAGLLKPARTDAETGYRYYHPGQLRTALTISLLRSLDIPLERIGELLVAGDDEAQALLSAEQERLHDEIAARQRAARSLARLSSDRDLMPHEVTTGTDPERHLIARTATTTSEALHRDSTELIDALVAELSPPPDKPVVGLYPVDLDGEFEIVVGIETGDAAAATVTLPAGAVARVLHTGPYDELPLAYYPLVAWAQERGHELRGPFRERYIDDPAHVSPDRLRTEVSIPITSPGGP
jgi:DNA-binding transcriptional MerR regulator